MNCSLCKTSRVTGTYTRYESNFEQEHMKVGINTT